MSIRRGTEFIMTIQGIDVNIATVEDVEGEDVVISWPAGRVVMSTTSTLREQEKEPTVHREMAHYDDTPDGGSEARESANREADGFKFQPTASPGVAQEHIGTTSLRDQALDSSILD